MVVVEEGSAPWLSRGIVLDHHQPLDQPPEEGSEFPERSPLLRLVGERVVVPFKKLSRELEPPGWLKELPSHVGEKVPIPIWPT